MAGKEMYAKQSVKSQLGKEGREGNGKKLAGWEVSDGPKNYRSWLTGGSGLE